MTNIPPRRSYGYIPDDEAEQTPSDRHSRSYGDQSPKQPPRPKTTVQKPWGRYLALPFRLLFYVLSSLFGWVLHLFQRGGTSSNHKKGSGRPNRHLIKKFFKAGMVLGVIALVFLTGFTIYISKDLPNPDKLTDGRFQQQSTKIYDRTGQHLLYEIFADEKRTLVTFDQLPKDLINGVVATEDKKFYDHWGVRPLSIIRSVVYRVIGKSDRIAGTSTLTQQLVKNAILTNERSITRKLKEAILSIELERKYTKNQILQIYFNEIPYGSTNYGVQSAAQSYFGKNVSELSLAESATLAGIPKAPSTYINNPEKLKTRRDFVLRRMYEEGYITEDQKTTAQAEPLEMKQTLHNIEAPHFVLYVKELLSEKYGDTYVETGGLKVITTLDYDKQRAAEEVIANEGEKVLAEAGANNTALLALDPKTGQILSMIGSKDYFDKDIKGQFNVVTLGRRQPGSSIKPIVYAAAFEKGYTPNTLLFDVVTNFAIGGKPYKPLNYSLQEYGPVTMRTALQNSLNITAVKTMYLVGTKKTTEFTKRLGYSTFNEENTGLALVLGGGEVNMIEHVNAYATFANYGVLHKPTAILKVEDAEGNILEEWKAEKGEQAISPALAATMSNVLSDDAARAMSFGTGGVLTLPGRPVAAKTGTTNEYKDGWTIGYTPSVVVGVWAGNTDNTSMKAGYGGSMVAARIWNPYMKKILADSPAEQFPTAPETKTDKPVLNGQSSGAITLSVDKVTGKIATSSTPERFIEQRTYMLPHSILHYVNKDDPQGPAPEDPTVDPQYTVWEASIQDWIARKKEKDPHWNAVFEEPPTEYDDAHSLDMIPTLAIVYPADGSTLNNRQIDTDIRVSAPRGVAKVTYQIDGVYVGVVHEHPFNLHYYAGELSPGKHTLTVAVEDDVGNRLSEEVAFILDAEEVMARATFSTDSLTLSASDFPKTISLTTTKLSDFTELTVIMEKDGKKKTITTLNNFDVVINNTIPIVLSTSPGPGSATLSVEVKTAGGFGAGDTMNVTVTD